MRQQRSFAIANPRLCKQALLEWAKQYDPVVWLDSNGHTNAYSTFDALLALGQPHHTTAIHTLQALRHIDYERDWLLGYFSYDLKNALEALSSNNFDGLGFPVLHFFRPCKLVLLQQHQLHFMYDTCCAQEIAHDFAQLMAGFSVQKRGGEGRGGALYDYKRVCLRQIILPKCNNYYITFTEEIFMKPICARSSTPRRLQ